MYHDGRSTPSQTLDRYTSYAGNRRQYASQGSCGFVAQDVEAAQLIPKEDDEVDALYIQVYRELVTVILTNPSTIDGANFLMWAAHNLERMADRVTNICERTIYVATGEMKEIDVSDDELKISKFKTQNRPLSLYRKFLSIHDG